MVPTPIPHQPLSSAVINKRYKLTDKIGSGSFGDVYRAISLRNGMAVAVKLENRGNKCNQLFLEFQFYQQLRVTKGKSSERSCPIPRYGWYGSEGRFNVLVMELLGPSLEDVFVSCSRNFTMKTVLMLADQMIGCIEYIHTNNFIHRDVKPDNFLIGVGKNSTKVYLIDFGLAKRFLDKTGRHIPCLNNKQLTGTVRYTSINSHLGIEQSRRDDLESIGYVLLYLIKGSLPWQGIDESDKRKRYAQIKHMKMSIPTNILCAEYPVIEKYMNYCRSLNFETNPDYNVLKQMFREQLRNENYQYDLMFDWQISKQKKTSEPLSSQSYRPKRYLEATGSPDYPDRKKIIRGSPDYPDRKKIIRGSPDYPDRKKFIRGSY